jgi:hypothetical protein
MRLKIVRAALLLGVAGCGAGTQAQFIGARIPDQCGANWPVCSTFAGCRIDNGSYVEGKLPGARKFIVHSVGPAHVDVALLVDNAQAQGQSTALTFFEPGCGVQYREAVDGKTFFAESQNQVGAPFVRGVDVSAGGDHLVQIDSDATATYLLKVTVTEKNPQGG